MPQISSFFGVIIRMFFDEHNPPHFHAQIWRISLLNWYTDVWRH
ncbi:MAG: DUF4160 domain-containing protein [Prevotellaceae bacterium]|nr:DUF4160 domain-containing protein [Prevotellaceae bacterium]